MIQRYRSKVSGPLLDRIDLHIEVPPVSSPELLDSIEGESSAAVASRVEAARRLQQARFEGRDGLYANGQMSAREVRKFCDADETGLSLLRSAMARFGLSARSFHRVLKIARTIADLAESETIRSSHIAEAIQYRGLDRNLATWE
jgi:magnesium chelatase family protein